MVAVTAQQRVLLPLPLAAVVDEVRDPLGVAPVGDHTDMPVLKGHNISRLPRRDIVGIGGQAFGVPHKEHPQVRHPSEIDVGIGLPFHPPVPFGVGRDIGVHHRLQVVAGVAEGPPDHIGADPPVLRRVAPGEVAGVVCRAVLGVLPGAQHKVGVIVDAVAVLVVGALQRFDAEMLRGISSMGQQPAIVQQQEQQHRQKQRRQQPDPPDSFSHSGSVICASGRPSGASRCRWL